MGGAGCTTNASEYRVPAREQSLYRDARVRDSDGLRTRTDTPICSGTSRAGRISQELTDAIVHAGSKPRKPIPHKWGVC